MKIIQWLAALAVLAGLSFFIFSVTTAHALDMKSYVDQDTVGDYRTWPETFRIAYLRGMFHFAVFGGLTCTGSANRSVGEYDGSLMYSPQLQLSDPLNKTFLALAYRNGCEVK